ncbi:aromatic ring-hydroxylating dioxygenase subunit alpha [Nocardia shimofusensis]|uniref:aromatic ring-hydroxylating dioxygenase subunit alpha n=1 Tax=Nocardia shimofusensis TaxID=228596 RepID=UPI00082A207E|nr:aromatic ring-hydroxylating dioxygenase subunit alpha [Nocardia shimofusensis]
MMKNFWYALEFADRVTRKPARVTCLGQEFVLYRDRAGKPVCMSDLCVHRGGSLAQGTVSGDRITCPYHGWEFDPDGACTKIPANAEGRTIPRKARVDAYPTEERYGMVWAFIGDLPEAERPPIPHIPQHDDPAFRMVQVEMEMDANYERVFENAVDASHTPFVHGTAFGNPDKPQIPDFAIRSDDWSAEADIPMSPPPPKGLWGWLSKRRQRPEHVVVTNGWYLPNVVKLHVRLSIGELILYDFNIPVSQDKTLIKILGYRNFFTGAWADDNARKRIEKILLQDRPVVEAQRPELLPFDLADELHVRSDGLQVAYRRRRNQLIKDGWWVGGDDIIAMPGPRRNATVIASPTRREHPELASAWVHRARNGSQPR